MYITENKDIHKIIWTMFFFDFFNLLEAINDLKTLILKCNLKIDEYLDHYIDEILIDNADKDEHSKIMTEAKLELAGLIPKYNGLNRTIFVLRSVSKFFKQNVYESLSERITLCTPKFFNIRGYIESLDTLERIVYLKTLPKIANVDLFPVLEHMTENIPWTSWKVDNLINTLPTVREIFWPVNKNTKNESNKLEINFETKMIFNRLFEQKNKSMFSFYYFVLKKIQEYCQTNIIKQTSAHRITFFDPGDNIDDHEYIIQIVLQTIISTKTEYGVRGIFEYISKIIMDCRDLKLIQTVCDFVSCVHVKIEDISIEKRIWLYHLTYLDCVQKNLIFDTFVLPHSIIFFTLGQIFITQTINLELASGINIEWRSIVSEMMIKFVSKNSLFIENVLTLTKFTEWFESYCKKISVGARIIYKITDELELLLDFFSQNKFIEDQVVNNLRETFDSKRKSITNKKITKITKITKIIVKTNKSKKKKR